MTLLGSERRRAALTEPTDAARDGSEADGRSPLSTEAMTSDGAAAAARRLTATRARDAPSSPHLPTFQIASAGTG